MSKACAQRSLRMASSGRVLNTRLVAGTPKFQNMMGGQDMSASIDENQEDLPTEEGRLVIRITRVLFKKDVDEALRVLGEYLDKHRLQVSIDVIREYELAGRISDK